ncbi:arginine N-succinyltransferase [Legionella sp. km772]|uniref:arginine N-succinyltransferase n=1 Tax=Legionella sp. km772 TaxID=2498111 RepID=UPI000F8E5244|nr:arginine N-succinyltransferase [Legionella sp. km772]RUR10405.1 arginine N-succinyltransferase [Legionella sp. km772]
MMLFRCALESDIEQINFLAKNSGVGMTTLPKNKKLLIKRILWSTKSYQKEVQQPDDEYYLFVLEDLQTNKIVGTSAIEARIGYRVPFYSYKVSKRTRICHSLKIKSDYNVLSLVNDNQGHSEICTLFLMPEYRKNNNGLLLSKARFLFMAHAPHRFAPTVIAELRGVSDEKGQSPFWTHVGEHFFHMPFAKADALTLATNKQFIADLMPRNPIYVSLLPKEAQDAIGKPHPSAVPAMNILLKEGFRYNKYIDIFDAGPTIEAPLSEIKTIENSRVMVIKNICDEVSNHHFLLANNLLNFRATTGKALLNIEQNTCTISKETADLLKVQCGDELRIGPLQTQAPSLIA